MESGLSPALQVCVRALPPNTEISQSPPHSPIDCPPTYPARSLSCEGKRYEKNSLSIYISLFYKQVHTYSPLRRQHVCGNGSKLCRSLRWHTFSVSLCIPVMTHHHRVRLLPSLSRSCHSANRFYPGTASE